MTEAVEMVIALLRCGHTTVFNGVIPNIGDAAHCDECGKERKVWFTPGVAKFHCADCKAASRSLLPAAIRGSAAQHAFKTGHLVLAYIEGKEIDAERFEGNRSHTVTRESETLAGNG